MPFFASPLHLMIFAFLYAFTSCCFISAAAVIFMIIYALLPYFFITPSPLPIVDAMPAYIVYASIAVFAIDA